MGARHRLSVCISLVVGLCLGSNARGQGFSALFPTPITSEELEEYAAILSLTGAQSQAIEGAFQEYQQACSAMGQDDIPRFNTDRRAALRDPEKQFDIRVQRKFHRRCLAIRARITALDNQFLEQLASQMPEDQQANMQHVRLLRERERYQSILLPSGEVRHEPTIDLTRLIGTIDLTAADRTALEPAAQGYDEALTASIRRYGSAAVERAIVYGTPQEQQERRRKTIERGIDVLNVNRTWLATMASVLPPQTAAKLQNTYRKEVYHGIDPDLENARRKFDAVLEMPQLGDEQKTAITTQRDVYIDQHARLTERIIAMLDHMRLSPEFWLAVASHRAAQLEGIDEVHALMDRRKKLNSEAVQTLSEYLGDGLFLSIRRASYKQYGHREIVRLPKRMPRFVRIQLASGSMAGSLTGGSPVLALFLVQQYAPIKTQWIQQLADELELTESQHDIVLTLHEQYVKDLMTQRDAMPQEIINGEQMLWARGEDDSFLPPTLDEVEELHDAKLRIIDSLRQIDTRFFDDLGRTVVSPDLAAKLAAARRARIRSLYLRRSGSRLWVFGSYIGGRSELYELDLLPLLNDIEPPAENVEQFNTLCAAYDVASATLAQQRFSAVHDCKLLADQMLVESFHDGDEYYEFSLIGDNDLARQFNGACKRLASAEEQYYQLNLSTPKQLMELLTFDVARVLQDRFREAAYPDIIEDPQAMHEKLETALHKPNLSEHEQQAIAELRGEYRQKYRALIDRLVATQRHPRDIAYYRIDDGQVSLNFHSQYGQESQEVAALKFERKEMNASIQRRLNLILKPEDRSPR
ncbi:MAG: hypothetical protein V3T84_00215 [Phycisphaerales bacterium]